jgi:hypothetical protein
LVGGYDVTNYPEDMVLRDTLVYVAELQYFQVVSVAEPRAPVLVGSCTISGTPRALCLGDSVAYVAQGGGGLVCVDVSTPSAPAVVGSWGGRSSGVSLADTIAYVAGPYTGLVSLSVANPAAPYVIDSLYLTDTLWWNDVAVNGSLTYVAGERVLTVDVSDPTNLRVRGSWTPPYLVRRVDYVSPYLFAACQDAGICILESTAVGLLDANVRPTAPALFLHTEPNPARGVVLITGVSSAGGVRLYDVSGRNVTKRVRTVRGSNALHLDVARLPNGVYFVDSEDKNVRSVVKLVKQ